MSLDLGKITTATGLLGCAWWSGITVSFSLFTVPALLDSSPDPTSALRAWSSCYDRGAATGPKVALTSFLALTYTAYDRYARAGPAPGGAIPEWAPFLAAALFGLGIIPYTLAFMMPTNNALKAGAKSKGDDAMTWERARELLRRWAALNFVRSLFHIVAAGTALWGLVREG